MYQQGFLIMKCHGGGGGGGVKQWSNLHYVIYEWLLRLRENLGQMDIFKFDDPRV